MKHFIIFVICTTVFNISCLFIDDDCFNEQCETICIQACDSYGCWEECWEECSCERDYQTRHYRTNDNDYEYVCSELCWEEVELKCDYYDCWYEYYTVCDFIDCHYVYY